jgi:16S rRNA (cytidine1402-2'-O)-methyltransferase
VFYEAPHRILDTIADAKEILGNRECVVARELTKLHEEFVRGSLSEPELLESSARGEIVLIIGPRATDQTRQLEAESALSINDQINQLMNKEGLDQKTALKRIARERGISKSEAYRLMISERIGKELL